MVLPLQVVYLPGLKMAHEVCKALHGEWELHCALAPASACCGWPHRFLHCLPERQQKDVERQLHCLTGNRLCTSADFCGAPGLSRLLCDGVTPMRGRPAGFFAVGARLLRLGG